VQSFLLHFWNQGAAYINANSAGNTVTQYWNFAQGFDAILDAIERTHTHQYYGWANTFYNTQAKIGFYRNWYDDENWMALALLRAHDIALTQQDTKAASNYLSAATTLLVDIAAAWDTTCCGSLKGGIWWDKSHSQKATAANAGPIILAARMYQRTGTQQYLTWAEQWYSWWSTHMVAASGQVADNYGTNGVINWWKFTYNNGLMVGAATELYKTTKNAFYPGKEWS
jgi:predicted alpha-1,6-mannanase (GH76 family)